jgi:hypothetical protein
MYRFRFSVGIGPKDDGALEFANTIIQLNNEATDVLRATMTIMIPLLMNITS